MDYTKLFETLSAAAKEAVEEMKKKQAAEEATKETETECVDVVPVSDVVEIFRAFREDCQNQIDALIGDTNPNAPKYIDILFAQIYACEKLEEWFFDALDEEE